MQIVYLIRDVYLDCRENYTAQSKKTSNPVTLAEVLNRHFSKDTKMTNELVARCLTPLIVTEMKIKTEEAGPKDCYPCFSSLLLLPLPSL